MQEDAGFALVSNEVRIRNNKYSDLGFITFPIGDRHPSNIFVQQSSINSTESIVSEIAEACRQTYKIIENRGHPFLVQMICVLNLKHLL